MGRAVLFLNGPNMPHIYGPTTLGDVEATVRRRAGELGVTIDFRQTNDQGELVTWIQQARGTADLIALNAGAYTHTHRWRYSNALMASEKPVIELHLSNNFRRENFRHLSYVSKAARGVIEGFGAQGYLTALEAAVRLLDAPDGSL